MMLFRASAIRNIAALFAAIVVLCSAAPAAAPKPAWLLTFSLSPVGGHIIGNPAAATRLVEYASYTCGHCGHFETTDVPQLKSQYVAAGKVSFEIRNLVRDELDLTAAMIARCGGKGRFFGNHRHLMATQGQWADGGKLSAATNAKLNADDLFGFLLGAYADLGLDKIMQARGVTIAQGKMCMNDVNALRQILAMTDEATGPLGLDGTPSFLVNGKVVDAYDLETLRPFLNP